jgi:DTW domain-containing protein YfiP
MPLKFTIVLFLLLNPLNCLCLSICLLTHSAEINRVTNTGKLATQVLRQEQCSTITWGGRDDNDRVERELRSLSDGGDAVLLWIDRHGSAPPPLVDRDPLYVVIDATWQEAQKIFRKGPSILRQLPRLSLNLEGESKYLLRRDYGYKKKFGEDNKLLCTAEVCASILRKEGFVEESKMLLTKLEIMNQQQNGIASRD